MFVLLTKIQYFHLNCCLANFYTLFDEMCIKLRTDFNKEIGSKYTSKFDDTKMGKSICTNNNIDSYR